MKKNLLDYIPIYPQACSEIYLALRTGYIKKPYTKERIKKGMKKLKFKIDLLTITHSCLVQRKLPMQLSTITHLKKEGCPIPEDMGFAVFLSRKAAEGE